MSRGAPSRGEEAQRPRTLLGAFFTLDPDRPSKPRPYALGFRNPWRLATDPDLGILVADAMFSEKAQEGDVLREGDNYGYPLDLETSGDFTPPVAELTEDVSEIISGLAVYRGSALPELDGDVLLADWHGDLVAADPTTGPPWALSPVDAQISDTYLWALASDTDGEVYALTTSQPLDDGQVLRLVSR